MKNGNDDDDSDDSYDSDAVLDPREKARLDKERELKADLNNAADLLGAAALGGAQLLFIYLFPFFLISMTLMNPDFTDQN